MMFPSLPVTQKSRHGDYADALISEVDAHANSIDGHHSAVGSGLPDLNEFRIMIMVVG